MDRRPLALTAVVAVCLAVVLASGNIFPNWRPAYAPDEFGGWLDHAHGFPVTYMMTASTPDDWPFGMSSYAGMWPIDDLAIEIYRPQWLALDIALASVCVVRLSPAVASLLRRLGFGLRFSMRTLLTLFVGASVLLVFVMPPGPRGFVFVLWPVGMIGSWIIYLLTVCVLIRDFVRFCLPKPADNKVRELL